MTTRRIRFAPLPDPRRSVILTDDGKEHPLPDYSDDWDEKTEWSCIPESLSLAIIGLPPTPIKTAYTPPPPPPPPVIKSKKRSALSSFLRLSHTHSHTSSPSTSPDSSPNPGYDSLSSSSSASSSSSIHTLTPTQSNDSSPTMTPTPKKSVFKQTPTTVPLNFGSGLFRTSSRDLPSTRKRSATESSSSPLSLSLSRWTSGPSSAKASSSSSPPVNFGVPLYRTQSTQSYKKSKRLAEQARASGLLSSLHSDKDQARPGHKMLNGRIYGAKRNSKGMPVNHFNTIKASEPEFVEWGYGGMGSVKHQKDGVGGKVWSRLAASEVDDSGGDGGGMDWVRKRKEKREREAREAKEREEREAKEKEQQQEQVEATTTPPRPALTTTTQITPTQSLMGQASPTPTRQQSAASDADSQQQHITRAVNVPAPVYRHHTHHHSNSHSRKPSLQLLPQTQGEAVKEESTEVFTAVKPVKELEVEPSSPTPPSSSASSSSEGEESDEEREGDQGEETDEEDEETERFRMTCRGAGVEKVSGHGLHR